MNHLLVRAEGQAVIDGVDVFDPAMDVVTLRKRVGMVFQKPNPFPKSIFDNVAYGLRVNNMKDRFLFLLTRVEESLKLRLFGMKGWKID